MTPTVTTTTQPTLMTAEEFIKLHGDESCAELVKGRVVRYPMPGAEHGEVCSKANYFLTQYAIDRFALAGTPNEVRARLERTVADGADEIGLILMSAGSSARGSVDQITLFAESVMQPLRAAYEVTVQ